MSQRTIIANDTVLVAPEIFHEGDEVALKVVVAGVVNGITSPTLKFFKQGSSTDLTSTFFTGTNSVSGTNTIITKTTQNLKAGYYLAVVGGVVDGQRQTVAKIPCPVKRESEL